ncbi:MAG: hypothetical protein ABW208_14390 [Pyrinomonadaceae bacterium]
MAQERERYTVNPSLEVGTGFKMRVRDKGAVQNIFMVKERPELCRLLVEMGSGDWSDERLSEIPPPLLAQLVELGVLIRRGEVADEVRFCCPLGEQPHELIPEKFRGAFSTRSATSPMSGMHAQGATQFSSPSLALWAKRFRGAELVKTSDENLVLNQRLYVQEQSEPPAAIADRVPHRENFLPSYPILWVEDPGTYSLSPYWPSRSMAEAFERLRSGDTSPTELSRDVAERLLQSRVLNSQGYEAARVGEWRSRCESLRAQLETEQYAVLRDIIAPLQLAALRGYFRRLDEVGYLLQESGKEAVDRHVMHNEPVARFVHQQINALINQIVPAPVKPSYCYLSVYQPGAVLPRHIDRPQCVWNLSLLIDNDPDVQIDDAWPIYLEVEGEAREVRLDLGDAVLYRGTEIPHWREALPEGQRSTLIFCHFVPIDFDQSLY